MCAQKVAVLLLVCLISAEAQYYYGGYGYGWPSAYYYGKRSAEASENSTEDKPASHEKPKPQHDAPHHGAKEESAEKVEKRSAEDHPEHPKHEDKEPTMGQIPEFGQQMDDGEHHVPLHGVEPKRFMMYVQNRPVQVPFAPVPYEYPQPRQQ